MLPILSHTAPKIDHQLRRQYLRLLPALDERGQREQATPEAIALGCGGIVAGPAGWSIDGIHRGIGAVSERCARRNHSHGAGATVAGTRTGSRSVHSATAHPTPLPGIEAITITSDRSFPRHAHDHFGIGRIAAGGHASWSAVGPVEAVAGDTIAVNPEEMHDGSPLARRERSWRMLFIPVDTIASISGFERDALELPFAATRDDELGRCVDRAFDRLVDTDRMAADEALTLLLARLFQDAPHGQGARRTRTAPSSATQRMLQRIHDDPIRSPSLDELSRVAGLDRFALLRRFATEVGTTPHAYTVQWRTRIARRAIVRGVALADAAALAGFADQSHLTRMFSRQFGLPPGRYRDVRRAPDRKIVQDVGDHPLQDADVQARETRA